MKDFEPIQLVSGEPGGLLTPPVPPAERQFLELLAGHPGFVPRAVRLVRPSAITHPQLRRLYTAIYAGSPVPEDLERVEAVLHRLGRTWAKPEVYFPKLVALLNPTPAARLARARALRALRDYKGDDPEVSLRLLKELVEADSPE